jgi:hypothetical protein
MVMDGEGKSKVEVTRVPTIEHVPPSDTAILYYLKNGTTIAGSSMFGLSCRLRDQLVAARQRNRNCG